MFSSRPKSFVIIGAGSAGLTAARTLLQRGCRDVLVIEALAQAGGKCRTVSIDDRAYDVGAVLGTRWDYRELLTLVQHHGLTVHDTRAADLPGSRRRWSFGARLRVVSEMLKYARFTARHRHSIRKGEMRNLDEDLCDTFATVASRRRMVHAERRLRAIYVGMGFGEATTIPMVYAANFMSLRTLGSVLRHGCFGLREGFQELWLREANELAKQGVRFLYSTRAIRIRRERSVEITLESGSTIECDKLIVACDPRHVGLDAVGTELDLFASTRNEDYRVLLCRIDGYPDIRVPTFYYSQKNIDEARAGRLMILYRKFPEANIYAAYMHGRGRNREEMEIQLEADIDMTGGRIREHLAHAAWSYFPHFSSEALKRGAFDSLARLQNQRHTIYVGEWADFGRLSRTMANARLNTIRMIESDLEVDRR